MRFVYGAIAVLIWCILGVYVLSKGVVVSNEVQVLTTAIVAAGAMAGGD